ncbi:hypothetical protein CTM93_13285 [Photobacterium phosphoreum]|uniref:hypothetical protein n=1 Tax=Photobacterium phosphoreum TaxID=659 RepID=UPI0009EE617A|nr:hypothetical protein [Photobacterium phosphoreum]PSU82558.1 hypothetical protein CTM93_13285 [Photobacterium phosphoreum]
MATFCRWVNVYSGSDIHFATAQGFLPAERIGRDLDFMNKIQIRNGVIMRTEQQQPTTNNVVLRP